MPKITPYFLRNLFGDALKGLWFPAVTDDAGNVLDLSGNGADGMVENGPGTERRSLAPGVPGKSVYFPPDNASIKVGGAECSGDMTWIFLGAKDTPEAPSNTYVFDWNIPDGRAALIINEDNWQYIAPDGDGGVRLHGISGYNLNEKIAAGQSQLIRVDARKAGSLTVYTPEDSASKSIVSYSGIDFSGGTFRIADYYNKGANYGWPGPIQFLALVDGDLISDAKLERAWQIVRDLSGVASQLTPHQTSDASRYVTGRAFDWLTAYNPRVLLEFEEKRGTIAADWSGDENDGIYEGGFTLNVDGPFSDSGKGVGLGYNASGGNRVDLGNQISGGPDHTFLFHGDYDTSDPDIPILLDIDYGGAARTFFTPSSGIASTVALYDGSWRESGYEFGRVASKEALLGASLEDATSTAFLYMNGLPFSEVLYISRTWDGTQEASLGSRGDGGDHPCGGVHSGFMHTDSVLTAEQHHQTAVDVGAAPPEGHYYKTKIVDELGLATLGVQGDVLAHLPLDETAGAQARDVSMYENHADFIGGPTLGADPLSPGARYSIQVAEADYVEIATGEDFSSGEYTVAFDFLMDVGASNVRNFAGTTDGTGKGIWAFTKDNQVRIRVDDGTTVRQGFMSIGMTNGVVYRLVFRWDWAAGSGYAKIVELNGTNNAESGIAVGDVSAMPALANAFRFGGSAGGGFNNLEGRVGLPTIYNRALTDNEIDGLLGA